jgi:hypothetical protein
MRQEPNKLTCAECDTAAADDASRWRAYLTDDEEVAVYCPDCARLEFDGV